MKKNLLLFINNLISYVIIEDKYLIDRPYSFLPTFDPKNSDLTKNYKKTYIINIK